MILDNHGKLSHGDGKPNLQLPQSCQVHTCRQRARSSSYEVHAVSRRSCLIRNARCHRRGVSGHHPITCPRTATEVALSAALNFLNSAADVKDLCLAGRRNFVAIHTDTVDEVEAPVLDRAQNPRRDLARKTILNPDKFDASRTDVISTSNYLEQLPINGVNFRDPTMQSFTNCTSIGMMYFFIDRLFSFFDLDALRQRISLSISSRFCGTF